MRNKLRDRMLPNNKTNTLDKKIETWKIEDIATYLPTSDVDFQLLIKPKCWMSIFKGRSICFENSCKKIYLST